MPDEFDRLIESLVQIDSASRSAADDLLTVRALALRDARRPMDDAGRRVELAPNVRALFEHAQDAAPSLPAEIAASIESRGMVLAASHSA